MIEMGRELACVSARVQPGGTHFGSGGRWEDRFLISIGTWLPSRRSTFILHLPIYVY